MISRPRNSARPSKAELTAWRKAHGLSRRQFAAILGVTLRVVRSWEQNATPKNNIPVHAWEVARIKIGRLVV